MTNYVATTNTPGYLPMDDEPAIFETAREAWEYLLSELERNDDYGVSAAWAPDSEDDPDGPQSRTETALQLERMASADWLVCDFERTGTVYGPTPGYDGDHDLGIAYSVTETEDEIPDY